MSRAAAEGTGQFRTFTSYAQHHERAKNSLPPPSAAFQNRFISPSLM
jgi:hypothetical protein